MKLYGPIGSTDSTDEVVIDLRAINTDLLAALKLIIGDWHGHVSWCRGPEAEGECKGSPSCLVIRKAIARAEGR